MVPPAMKVSFIKINCKNIFITQIFYKVEVYHQDFVVAKGHNIWEGHREAICSQWPPQVVVAKDHNIWEVTESLFADNGNQSVL